MLVFCEDGRGKNPVRRTMRVQPDSFILEFTQPVDPATVTRPESYTGTSFTYIYQQKYGTPEIDPQPIVVTAATVQPDGKSVRLHCTGLRERYVHEFSALGVRLRGGEPVVNPTAYWTFVARHYGVASRPRIQCHTASNCFSAFPSSTLSSIAVLASLVYRGMMVAGASRCGKCIQRWK